MTERSVVFVPQPQVRVNAITRDLEADFNASYCLELAGKAQAGAFVLIIQSPDFTAGPGAGRIYVIVMNANVVLDRLTALLGPPGPTGWRLVFPADGHEVSISVRAGFGLEGAVWFEEPFEDMSRSWWVPLNLPQSLERVVSEIETLKSEGALPAGSMSA